MEDLLEDPGRPLEEVEDPWKTPEDPWKTPEDLGRPARGLPGVFQAFRVEDPSARRKT